MTMELNILSEQVQMIRGKRLKKQKEIMTTHDTKKFTNRGQEDGDFQRKDEDEQKKEGGALESEVTIDMKAKPEEQVMSKTQTPKQELEKENDHAQYDSYERKEISNKDEKKAQESDEDIKRKMKQASEADEIKVMSKKCENKQDECAQEIDESLKSKKKQKKHKIKKKTACKHEQENEDKHTQGDSDERNEMPNNDEEKQDKMTQELDESIKRKRKRNKPKHKKSRTCELDIPAEYAQPESDERKEMTIKIEKVEFAQETGNSTTRKKKRKKHRMKNKTAHKHEQENKDEYTQRESDERHEMPNKDDQKQDKIALESDEYIMRNRKQKQHKPSRTHEQDVEDEHAPPELDERKEMPNKDEEKQDKLSQEFDESIRRKRKRNKPKHKKARTCELDIEAEYAQPESDEQKQMAIKKEKVDFATETDESIMRKKTRKKHRMKNKTAQKHEQENKDEYTQRESDERLEMPNKVYQKQDKIAQESDESVKKKRKQKQHKPSRAHDQDVEDEHAQPEFDERKEMSNKDEKKQDEIAQESGESIMKKTNPKNYKMMHNKSHTYKQDNKDDNTQPETEKRTEMTTIEDKNQDGLTKGNNNGLKRKRKQQDEEQQIEYEHILPESDARKEKSNKVEKQIDTLAQENDGGVKRISKQTKHEFKSITTYRHKQEHEDENEQSKADKQVEMLHQDYKEQGELAKEIEENIERKIKQKRHGLKKHKTSKHEREMEDKLTLPELKDLNGKTSRHEIKPDEVAYKKDTSLKIIRNGKLNTKEDIIIPTQSDDLKTNTQRNLERQKQTLIGQYFDCANDNKDVIDEKNNFEHRPVMERASDKDVLKDRKDIRQNDDGQSFKFYLSPETWSTIKPALKTYAGKGNTKRRMTGNWTKYFPLKPTKNILDAFCHSVETV